MNARILAALLFAPLLVQAATSLREPHHAEELFIALPRPTHPGLAAELAGLSDGRFSLAAMAQATGSIALSVPHFQLVSSTQALELTDPTSRTRLPDRQDRNLLSLGTALSLSQFGLSGDDWDLSLGGGYRNVRRDSARAVFHTGTLDLSARLDLGSLGARLAFLDAVRLQTWGYEEPLDSRILVGAGQVLPRWGLQYGGNIVVPTTSHGGLEIQLAAEKSFLDALAFRAQVTSVYQNLVREGFAASIGTNLRFRPWVEGRDPDWVRGLVDPLRGKPYLYDFDLAILAHYDIIAGTAAAGVSLTRWF